MFIYISFFSKLVHHGVKKSEPRLMQSYTIFALNFNEEGPYILVWKINGSGWYLQHSAIFLIRQWTKQLINQSIIKQKRETNKLIIVLLLL
jgi:hypothetical protein